MFPPLKKTKNEEKDKSIEKTTDMAPPPTLARRPTEEEDRKYVIQAQNTCIIRKFNSRKKIEKKKIVQN